MSLDVPMFIGDYPNLMSDESCDRAIELFENANQFGLTQNRSEHSDTKAFCDDQMLFNCFINAGHLGADIYNEIVGAAWQGYNKFINEYPIALERSDKHHIHAVKMQKTMPKQGFHQWHYENSTRDSCNRLLTYTVYLNDVDEGGETEFLYYSRRVKAEKGKVCIFPAGFTHLHRGNPPLSGNKYIATGWFEF